MTARYSSEMETWRNSFNLRDENPLHNFRSFVAISHVWADGLGNPSANALPRCQLSRIRERLQPRTSFGNRENHSTGSLWIWMDTLCIPVEAKYQTTRQKAIDQMALVYASAESVLVLDRSIARLSYPHMGPVERCDPPAIGLKTSYAHYLRSPESYMGSAEVLGRILCSPWAGRSWTLQEAVVPQYVNFAFKDQLLTSQWLEGAAAPLLRASDA